MTDLPEIKAKFDKLEAYVTKIKGTIEGFNMTKTFRRCGKCRIQVIGSDDNGCLRCNLPREKCETYDDFNTVMLVQESTTGDMFCVFVWGDQLIPMRAKGLANISNDELMSSLMNADINISIRRRTQVES